MQTKKAQWQKNGRERRKTVEARELLHFIIFIGLLLCMWTLASTWDKEVIEKEEEKNFSIAKFIDFLKKKIIFGFILKRHFQLASCRFCCHPFSLQRFIIFAWKLVRLLSNVCVCCMSHAWFFYDYNDFLWL